KCRHPPSRIEFVPSMTLVLRAHAKVNLHLAVGRRRADGYHNLKTIFQEISLRDTLRFTPADSEAISLTIQGNSALPSDDSNRVIRALDMLRRRLGVRRGLRVHLSKAIPTGAGLGGGSSDAAAALWGGWLLWRKKNYRNKKFIRPRRPPKILFGCARR